MVAALGDKFCFACPCTQFSVPDAVGAIFSTESWALSEVLIPAVTVDVAYIRGASNVSVTNDEA